MMISPLVPSRRPSLGTLLMVLGLSLPLLSLAQTYPDKPIKLIVPWAPRRGH